MAGIIWLISVQCLAALQLLTRGRATPGANALIRSFHLPLINSELSTHLISSHSLLVSKSEHMAYSLSTHT